MSFDLKITADMVAWYGAIVATTSVLFSGYNIYRDRPRLKIQFQRNLRIINAVLPYEEDKDYFSIIVINKGQRTTSIGNVGIKLYTKGSLIITDCFTHGKNKILNEQNPRVEFLTREEEINFHNCYYIQVFDQTGKTYRKYFSHFPTFARIIYLMSHFNER